jgi:excisionase family DNA binding protein
MIKLYNVKEVSKILSLSVSCLYKMAERKEIQSVKIGSALRFLESDIHSFLEKCKTIQTESPACIPAIEESDYDRQRYIP